AHTWTSVATDLGHWTGQLAQWLGVATRDQLTLVWRLIGLAVAGVLTLIVLLRHDKYPPVIGLDLGFGAVVFLGPVLHPWYLTWAIVPLAAAATSPRLRRVIVGVTVAFTLTVIPGGVQPSLETFAGAAFGAAAVFVVNGLLQLPSVRRALTSAVDAGRQILQREPVTVHAQSTDHTGRYRRDDGLVPELLTGVDVGDVHLHEGGAQQGTRVAERVRVMRPRAGIE